MVEIHQQISEVSGKNAMNDRMVRKLVTTFKDFHTNVYNEG